MSDWPYTPEQLSGVNSVDQFGRTRLMYAAESRDARTLEALLKEGANPNLQAIYRSVGGEPRYAGVTALILAVENNALLCAKTLLVNGADPNMRAYYTDPGMGNYDVLARDKCKSPEMRDLLDAYHASPERGGWAKTLDRSAALRL
jgi:hypothetical protein